MVQVIQCDVPDGSELSAFGGPDDYRDCFFRDVPGHVSLADFIERFYRSGSFLPERLILKALRTPASSADIRAIAHGETDHFGAWKVTVRKETEALLHSKDTNTASWFCVHPIGPQTRLYFGSWVGSIGQSGWQSMLKPHVWYSRFLLAGV